MTRAERRALACGRALACVAAGLGGCAGSTRELFVPEVVAADRSAVYVYRPDRAWSGAPVRVVIDQQLVGELDAGEYLAASVTAGEHLVRVEGVSSAACRVEPDSGEAVYLEVRSSRWNPRPALENVGSVVGRPAIGRTRRAR